MGNIHSKSFRLRSNPISGSQLLQCLRHQELVIILYLHFPPGIANISIHDNMFMTFYGQLYITYFDIIFYYMGLKICIYKIAIFILIKDSQVG